MRAVVLIGGYGTRLRPLSYTTPKSLLPIANIPFLRWILEWFRHHEITELVFALGNLSTPILEFLDAYDGDLSIETVLETKPLGSGGALKNCAHLLDGPFILFNGDILTDLDLRELVRFHQERQALVTATLSEVDDPSQYGIVDLDPESRALQWQEKPTRDAALSRWGNVGAWVMEPEVLDYIDSGRPVSIEREIFPLLFAAGVAFYGYRFSGYWKDIGTIDKYIQANRDLLCGVIAGKHPKARALSEGILIGDHAEIGEGVTLAPPVLIGEGARLGKGVTVVGPTVIGNECNVGESSCIESSLLWPRAKIGACSRISCALIGTAEIGAYCSVGGEAVVGSSSLVAPHSALPEGTVLGPGSIIKIE
jgi:mannose-1-phosphate guanylyltransferase